MVDGQGVPARLTHGEPPAGRQCRRRGEAVNNAVAGVAALHNLKIGIP
jgi:hypothetical protein